MPSLMMSGQRFHFNEATINRYVESGRIGNYALGYDSPDGFFPTYVGRSDSDLNAELRRRLPATETHRLFKFSYANTIKEAFEKECRNYHDFFDNLENENHPARPSGSYYRCPICGS